MSSGTGDRGRVLRSRSQSQQSSQVKQRKTKEVTKKSISTREYASTSSFDQAFGVNGIFENGDSELYTSQNIENETNGELYETTEREEDYSKSDSPWQNGRYKSAEEIVSYYRNLGDWWNYLPKTDNTYNSTSKWYRKEIAPGIPVIPNMARPPLHPVAAKPSRFSWFSNENSSIGSRVTTETHRAGSSTTSGKGPESRPWYQKVLSFITSFLMAIWRIITFSSSPDSSFEASRATKSNYAGYSVGPRPGSSISVSSYSSSWQNSVYNPLVWVYYVSSVLIVFDIYLLKSIRQTFSKIFTRRFLMVLLPLLVLSTLAIYYKSWLIDHSKALLTDTEWIMNTSFAEHTSHLSSILTNASQTLLRTVSS